MMGYTQVGTCSKCGAPIYCPTTWWSILPPPSHHSCNCFPKIQTITTNNTNRPIFQNNENNKGLEK